MAKNRRGSSREDPLNPYAAIDSTVPCIARSRERRHHGQATGRQVVWPPHAATEFGSHSNLKAWISPDTADRSWRSKPSTSSTTARKDHTEYRERHVLV
jgi:hypothetical protein